jgi:hypothetical protein
MHFQITEFINFKTIMHTCQNVTNTISTMKKHIIIITKSVCAVCLNLQAFVECIFVDMWYVGTTLESKN